MNIYTHILIDTHRHMKYIPIKHTQGCGMNWEVGIDTRTILMLCYAMLSRSVVSDSVRPHRWQPTRLPRPWDSPGKNTGVGCHFLLQCMKLSRVRLCATPWTAAHQTPPSMGFSRQEYWSGVPLPSPTQY